ncbi:MAG: tripartite tricarboxylate transporter TctB family protein [Kiloniellales bacterium]|nr:tripartite tricarboxylate transporter TctB family protein [Kiloniellales bacterium]
MSTPWRNVAGAAVLLPVSVGYLMLALDLPDRPMIGAPGPGFFPILIGTCLLVLSVVLLVQGITALRAGDAREASGGWAPSRQAFAVLGCFAVYLLLLPTVGFVLASIPFFAVLMHLYGARRGLVVAVGAFAAPVVLFVIFRYGFRIVPPRGLVDF